jgi:SAM-dependent methyltransferase
MAPIVGETAMAEHQIRFVDGAAYERMMGAWSRIAGEVFLDWLAPAVGLRWLDVGCGSGAFTELVSQRCAPSSVDGIDPAEPQLAYARTRSGTSGARFRQGDAMALPFPDDSFDAATMALVIFFVPEPAKGVAEMARVVAPGGIVAAYAWDMLGGGFPLAALRDSVAAMGITPPAPPSAAASKIEALRGLWTGAGLEAVETRAVDAPRTFADFDEFWATARLGVSMTSVLASMSEADVARVKEQVRGKLPPSPDGRVTIGARANAVKGRVPV